MALRIGDKKKIFAGKYLNVWATTFFDKNNNEQIWEWVERRNGVYIFPITPQQNVVLIENFRVPLERSVIEMPAGSIDVAGEILEHTAKRELREETGYNARTLIPLRHWPYRAANSNNISAAYIAIGLEKVSHVVGDATEDISVIEVPMSGLVDFYLNLPKNTLFDVTILAVHNIAQHLQILG